MMMRRTTRAILWVLFLMLVAVPSEAQEGEAPLTLGLRRDFGFGSGVQMQGRFSYRVDAPEAVGRVEFLLDGQVIGEDTEAPFRLAFNTGNYEEGWHALSAVGYTAAGERLPSNTLQRQFVPRTQTFTYLGAILLLILAYMVVRYLITRPRGTDASGKERQGYGLLGGAVCPRCGRPFALPLWSINLMAGRFTRCPHCGKWSFVQRASPEVLAEAEAFERELDLEAAEGAAVLPDAEEQLRRRLDDSRYDDL